MFNLFKKNKSETGILPFTGQLPVRLDMHSHILPGIDDGAADLETALDLVRGLYALGIRQCIATPHIIGDLYRNNAETIGAALILLQDGCRKQGIDMHISAAAEYMLDDQFMDMLQQKQPLLTLHKNIILTEFAYTTEPQNIQDMAFAIITEGYQPILAHPERYFYFHRNYDAYHRLQDLGFYLQVNLLSLTGYYGKEVSKAAAFILKKGLAQLVGTDLHHARHLKALGDAGNIRLFEKYLGAAEWNRMLAVD